MSTTARQVPEASAQLTGRVAGFFWLMTIVTGACAMMFVSGRMALNQAATVCYLVATWLVFNILKPVNGKIALLGAFFSLLGCVIGTLGAFHLVPVPVNPLVFFGLHCLLVGYLIIRSTFLPRVLGVLLALGGLSWLTFASPPLASQLAPYNLAPGILGEGALSLWLLVVGLNEQRWKEQAGT